MSMSKKILLIIPILLLTFLLSINNVYAANSPCNYYSSQGESVCIQQTYKGKKCDWNGALKGGSRCYDSGKLAEEVKETITSCKQITEPETCRVSKINGHECIWRQNACYSNTIINDGTNETIIADDKVDRENQEQNNNSNNSSNNNIPCSSLDKKACQYNRSCEWNGSNCIDSFVAADPCNDNNVRTALRFFGYLLMIAKVAIPLIIIVVATFDLFKSVVDKDEKSFSKQVRIVLMRIVAGIFVFFLPTLVYALFNLSAELKIVDDAKYQGCATCLLKPTQCSINK